MKRSLVCAIATVSCLYLVLLATGCDTAAGVPDEWKIFECEAMSLALPDEFAGGDAFDPSVAAEFERLGIDWVLPPDPSDIDAALQMYGEPDSSGYRAFVFAVQDLDNWLPFLTPEDYADILAKEFPNYVVERMTPDEAYVVFETESPWDVGRTATVHLLFVKGEPCSDVACPTYTFTYLCDKDAAAKYEPIFRKSIETIVIN